MAPKTWLLGDMRKLAPFDFDAWLNLNNIVGRQDGAYRQNTAGDRCCRGLHHSMPLCIEAHAKAARAAGASRRTGRGGIRRHFLRAGGAATHGAMALKFFDGEK